MGEECGVKWAIKRKYRLKQKASIKINDFIASNEDRTSWELWVSFLSNFELWKWIQVHRWQCWRFWLGPNWHAYQRTTETVQCAAVRRQQKITFASKNESEGCGLYKILICKRTGNVNFNYKGRGLNRECVVQCHRLEEKNWMHCRW